MKNLLVIIFVCFPVIAQASSYKWSVVVSNSQNDTKQYFNTYKSFNLSDELSNCSIVIDSPNKTNKIQTASIKCKIGSRTIVSKNICSKTSSNLSNIMVPNGFKNYDIILFCNN